MHFKDRPNCRFSDHHKAPIKKKGKIKSFLWEPPSKDHCRARRDKPMEKKNIYIRDKFGCKKSKQILTKINN